MSHTPRLLDIGLEKLTNLLMDMASLSEKAVSTAIQAYGEGSNVKEDIFRWSEQLRILQDEVSELAVELIARYQPVASDLRFIKSCMEIAYGFSRFGRYAYDIAVVLETFGDLSHCDHSQVQVMGEKVKEMIRLGIQAFAHRDTGLASRLSAMDDEVDDLYVKHVKNTVNMPHGELICHVSATLILRYLERIADHANYIADAVLYIVKGERASRK